MIKLSSFKFRPHHSLCIQFFEGKGYSDDFVFHMNKIIKKLELSDPIILITDCCDDICKYCPNNNNGIGFGESLYWSELKKLALEKIINKKRLYEICSSCQWYDVCKDKLYF